jgi:hypothetical protein
MALIFQWVMDAPGVGAVMRDDRRASSLLPERNVRKCRSKLRKLRDDRAGGKESRRQYGQQ